jgi:hypothetical protein
MSQHIHGTKRDDLINLENRYAKEKKKVQEKKEEELQSLKQSYQDRIEKTRDQGSATVNLVRSQNSEELNQIRTSQTDQIKQLRDLYIKQEGDLKQKKNHLQSHHEERIQKIKKDQKFGLEKIQTEFDKKLDDMKSGHQNQVKFEQDK